MPDGLVRVVGAQAEDERRAAGRACSTFLAQRLLQLIPTLFFVSMLIFGLQQLLPGDPALIMAGEERDPEVIAQIREQYQLDQPIPVQYLYWIKGVLTGDLGESMRLKVPVRELIAEKLPVTLQLAVMAMVIALADRHPGRHHLGGEEGHGLGLRRQPVRAVGHLDAEFLARHHADLPVLGDARLAAGLGLRARWARTGARASPPRSCRPSCSATPSPAS